ncbi:hypothetical protein E2C01_043310 [Portunus trituberculatus]|uniref:Uncharacterized protein n=1 Tax=Portunus trituberculatus TaxID=210409 RepID=A0A5B7FVS7_PORTR|nr:hypothetical protein [Portunus trituberculatus]
MTARRFVGLRVMVIEDLQTTREREVWVLVASLSRRSRGIIKSQFRGSDIIDNLLYSVVLCIRKNVALI